MVCTVCQSTSLEVSSIQRVNVANRHALAKGVNLEGNNRKYCTHLLNYLMRISAFARVKKTPLV